MIIKSITPFITILYSMHSLLKHCKSFDELNENVKTLQFKPDRVNHFQQTRQPVKQIY